MCVCVCVLPLTQISYDEHSSLSNRQPVADKHKNNTQVSRLTRHMMLTQNHTFSASACHDMMRVKTGATETVSTEILVHIFSQCEEFTKTIKRVFCRLFKHRFKKTQSFDYIIFEDLLLIRLNCFNFDSEKTQ